MTVKQLMIKLKKLPENTIVTICNNDMYINGEYIATEVDYDKEYNMVNINSDYSHRIDGGEE